MNSHAKRDWHKYNQKLINPGSLTFWLDKDCLNSWINKHGKRAHLPFQIWLSKQVGLLNLSTDFH
jgi:hypothetical protein